MSYTSQFNKLEGKKLTVIGVPIGSVIVQISLLDAIFKIILGVSSLKVFKRYKYIIGIFCVVERFDN